jgi:hypothetical protein
MTYYLLPDMSAKTDIGDKDAQSVCNYHICVRNGRFRQNGRNTNFRTNPDRPGRSVPYGQRLLSAHEGQSGQCGRFDRTDVKRTLRTCPAKGSKSGSSGSKGLCPTNRT